MQQFKGVCIPGSIVTTLTDLQDVALLLQLIKESCS
jgi:hypothetical protein